MSSSINILDKSWSEASNDFYDQLEGNIKELNSSKYPIHWLDILDAVDDVKADVKINTKSIEFNSIKIEEVDTKNSNPLGG